MGRLLLVISFLFIAELKADTEFKCLVPGKIRFVKNTNFVTDKRDYCINHSVYKIISYNCLKNQRCKAMDAYKNMGSFAPIPGKIGSPSHQKCFFLEGSPALVEYFDGQNWIQSGICKFDDQSFISLFNEL